MWAFLGPGGSCDKESRWALTIKPCIAKIHRWYGIRERICFKLITFVITHFREIM